MSVNDGADALTGSLSLVGSDSQTHNITLGQAGTDTLTNLAGTINGLGYGITASLSSDSTEITFLSTDSADSVTATSTITDTYTSTSQTDRINNYIPGVNIGYYTVGNAADTLSGAFTGTDKSGNSFSLALDNTDNTIATLAAALNVGGADAGLGINALVAGNELSFTARNGDTDAPWLTPGESFTETGSFTNVSDVSVNAAFTSGAPGITQVGQLRFMSSIPGLTTGSISVGLYGTIQMDASDTSIAAIIQTINNANAGVTATLSGNRNVILTSANGSMRIHSSLVPTSGSIQAQPGGSASYFSASNVIASLEDITANPLTYDSNPFYAGTEDVGEVADPGRSASPATPGSASTLRYTDGAGQNLSATDLSNQTNAEAALTSINAAISDVASQDGYLGSQIITLNAVGQVLGTQAQNVQSAQNAVEATDYAKATSDLSKYEILGQTGIAALAQANAMQREVTKLLQ